ncbi:hypothetical protein EsVE80_21640 [Enterococcus saigonensis]|uniref:Siphovirus-type tail component RIFT-related domain-containing protein n=1 Tax=Enterococcus saigonensis TaxID=1805431 RepID=A0A679IP43_9ENTE|nr:phage tail domain-containing protein [Enterococcus saigonensis]BCA86641.1 hypothetical protein EsVE80_21640 [Enterococcus saigonensis]
MFYKVQLNQNGEWFDPQQHMRIVFKNIIRQSPVYEVEYVDFAGTNGSREANSSFRPFELVFEIDLFFDDENDRELLETELHQLFFPGYSYYLNHDLAPGKMFLVNPISFELQDEIIASNYANYKVTLNVFRGYAESLATTLTDFSLGEEWQFSQGLVSEDHEYTHQTSRFTIFNAGDFTIDPRENYLKIKIEGMSDGNLTVFNATTGERFIYRGSLNSVSGETLTLDGVYPLKNGIHCGIDTNHGLISLVPGENKIEISNASRIKTAWDFRFLYK